MVWLWRRPAATSPHRSGGGQAQEQRGGIWVKSATRKANTAASIYRNDADLKAWLAKRPTEAALEPELPIIDPHHHFWDTPHRGQLFPARTAGRHRRRPQHRLDRLPRMPGDVSQGRPAAMAPVGEVEFVNGIAAMSASGNYGPCRVAEAIIGYADLRLGARVRDVLEAEIAAGGGRFRGIRHGVAWDGNEAVGKFASRAVPPHLVRDPKFRDGLRRTGEAGAEFRVVAVSSATTGRDRSRARLPRHHDHPQPRRRRARRRALFGTPAGNPELHGARTSPSWRNARTST